MNALRSLSVLVSILFVSTALAQVPQILNYQGRIVVGTTNFDGSGLFKFALVNSNGTVSFWSNDGTSAAGSQPTASVSLGVVSPYSGRGANSTSNSTRPVSPSTVRSKLLGAVRPIAWP